MTRAGTTIEIQIRAQTRRGLTRLYSNISFRDIFLRLSIYGGIIRSQVYIARDPVSITLNTISLHVMNEQHV